MSHPDDDDGFDEAEARERGQDYVEELETKLAAAREVLRKVEWSAAYGLGCILCGEAKHEGHAPDCELKKALEDK